MGSQKRFKLALFPKPCLYHTAETGGAYSLIGSSSRLSHPANAISIIYRSLHPVAVVVNKVCFSEFLSSVTGLLGVT